MTKKISNRTSRILTDPRSDYFPESNARGKVFEDKYPSIFFKSVVPPRGTLTVSGKQNSLFPFGPVIKYDNLQQIEGVNKTIDEIRRRRWNWIGHIVRSEEYCVTAMEWRPVERTKTNMEEND